MEWPGPVPEAGGTTETTGHARAGAPDPPEAVEARLAAIEDLCIALAQRLDGLEAGMRTAVADEVRSVSDELRHTVSELGRLLVRDLGRLSKLLDHHRDEIVAELRPPEPVAEPEPEPAPEPPPATDGPDEPPAAGEADDDEGNVDDAERERRRRRRFRGRKGDEG